MAAQGSDGGDEGGAGGGGDWEAAKPTRAPKRCKRVSHTILEASKDEYLVGSVRMRNHILEFEMSGRICLHVHTASCRQHMSFAGFSGVTDSCIDEHKAPLHCSGCLAERGDQGRCDLEGSQR